MKVLESQYLTVTWISLGLCLNSPLLPAPLSLGFRGERGLC